LPRHSELTVSVKAALGRKKVCSQCGAEKCLRAFRVRVKGDSLYVDATCNTCVCRRQRRSLRLQFLEEFGCTCSCCGETHPDLLSLEHIRGNVDKIKAAYRKASYYLYAAAKRDNWDRSKYECLCMSCNWAKGIYGICPHRSGVSAEQSLEKLRREAERFFDVPTVVKNREAGYFNSGFDGRRPKQVALVKRSA
jgi:hypothetical protein